MDAMNRGLFQAKAAAFDKLVDVGAGIVRLATGYRFTEGPVWLASERKLLFSDIPSNQIRSWSEAEGVGVFREPSGNSNGLTLDEQGRLLACEHGNRRVSRADIVDGGDGGAASVADRFDGKPLNSPNDIVVTSAGVTYFTDPPYGIKPEQQEQPIQGVYRMGSNGEDLTVVADDFEKPNGLAFSPDEKTLYIDDSGRRHLRAFNVTDAGDLTNGRVITDMDIEEKGSPDGMKVDTQGNVYCTAAGGVWVLDPAGAHLGMIVTPEKPANCAWGDDDWCSLFVTAQTSVYRVRVKVAGIPVP